MHNIYVVIVEHAGKPIQIDRYTIDHIDGAEKIFEDIFKSICGARFCMVMKGTPKDRNEISYEEWNFNYEMLFNFATKFQIAN